MSREGARTPRSAGGKVVSGRKGTMLPDSGVCHTRVVLWSNQAQNFGHVNVVFFFFFLILRKWTVLVLQEQVPMTFNSYKVKKILHL